VAFENVSQPAAGGFEVFARTDDAAVQTAAASLLALGVQLRGTANRLRGNFTSEEMVPMEEILPDYVRSALKLPLLQEIAGKADSAGIRQFLQGKYKLDVPVYRFLEELLPHHRDAFADLAKIQVEQASADAVFNLLEACLSHSQELVRVCAATAFTQHTSELPRLIDILAVGTKSQEPLVRNVAATALAIEQPEHPALLALRGESGGAASLGASNTTMIIHGTWAATSPWWQPGGDFHTYILNNVRNDLYNKADRFGWSGAYSDAARAQAAQDLVAWVNAHNEQGLDLITHSHGGNVSMLATHQGLTIGELIMLSCPVHFPKYAPDFSKINKRKVSIRVHADLVILADRGGQKFKDPRIEENVLPIWFNHSATHDPAVWQQNNVPAKI
jgi:hypothetical protein